MHDSKRRRVRRAKGGILHAAGEEEEEEEELGKCRLKSGVAICGSRADIAAMAMSNELAWQ